MKKFLTFILALSLLLSLSACGEPQTVETSPVLTIVESPDISRIELSQILREYTDSTGRTVYIPQTVKRIAVTGPLSQIYILPLAGDMLVGVSNAYTEDAGEYLPGYVFEIDQIGQLYGSKSELDLEALLAAEPELVIDIGEPKDGIANDLAALTEQTGIPFIHIDATVATAPEAYRILGELLGREEKAEVLAQWCEKTYETVTAMMEKVDGDNARKSLLYCLGDKGTQVLAADSFHAETINLLSRNPAVLEDTVSSGAGNEVDMEQILLWDPEYIIFAPGSCYDTVGTDPQWQKVTAVAEGRYYEAPALPYGWLSSPPAVQRYLGMLWLGAVLYPEYAQYDLQEQVSTFYKLFYDCELTDDMYRTLTINALGK